nr:hypothetical protein [Lachnospiraceae bacterium]
MKRNWKRILSLLLTAALVFTMNTGVFADEVPEQPVEEQVELPAEETAPAEPVVEETTGETEPEEVEAPEEEPAPTEEEAEPAVAEESTPEPEQPASVSMDYVGIDTLGWTITIGGNPATADDDYTATEGGEVALVKDGNYVLTPSAEAQEIKISGHGAGTNVSFSTGELEDGTITYVVLGNG